MWTSRYQAKDVLLPSPFFVPTCSVGVGHPAGVLSMKSDMLHRRDLSFLLCNGLLYLACSKMRWVRFETPPLPHHPTICRSPLAHQARHPTKLPPRRYIPSPPPALLPSADPICPIPLRTSSSRRTVRSPQSKPIIIDHRRNPAYFTAPAG